MPIPNEIPRTDKDASAGVDTIYCFVPNADGSFDRSNNAFRGELRADIKDTEDWVIIELKAGTTYTFTLQGEARPVNPLMPAGEMTDPIDDPLLALYDSKGDLIEMNDDVGLNDIGLGRRDATVTITPEVSGIYYVSASTYRGNPNRDDYGTYVIRVHELPENNEIVGTDGQDKLEGTDSARPDVIDGEGGNDSLYGGGGEGQLAPNDGKDADTISYKYSMEGVTINLLTGAARGGDAEGDTFGTDIEDVQGSMHDDRLSGDNRTNKLWGLEGNDYLYGDNGKDVLNGGPGDDELDGGDGDDSLTGGPGADELTGGEGEDTASYARSSAGVTVRLHAFQAMGGDAEGDTFEDTVIYPWTDMDEDDNPVEREAVLSDVEHLTGSNHDDILAGDHRANTISGGRGDDKLYGGPSGDDTNIDTLLGGSGNDMLFGGRGGDTLDGGKGNDMLSGGPGEDTLFGGFGSDTFFITFEEGVTGNPDSVNGEGMPVDEEADEDLNGNGTNGEQNVIIPDPNPRSQDTISFEKWVDDEENTGVTLSLAAADDNVVGIENIIGSADDDMLTGDDGDNVIEGGDGEDVLVGGAHGTGGDTVSYRSSDRGVKIDLSDDTPADRGSRGDAAGDSIDGFENIIGSAHDDDLRGTFGDGSLADANTIEGLAGADVLDGGDTDTTGDQTLTQLNALLDSTAAPTDGVNDRADTLSYRSSSAGVTVNLATASASGGDATDDEIETFDVDYDHDADGTETDPTDAVETEFSTFENIIGSAHRDNLTGDDRINVIHGGAGDDVLKGGRSGDTLEGGPGADTLDGGHTRTSNTDESDMFTDTASYSFAAAGVTVDIDAGRGTGGDAMGDRFISIEHFLGSRNDDMFIASEDADSIDGGAHNADDVNLDGEADYDQSDGDTVSYEKSEEGVWVNLGDTDAAGQTQFVDGPDSTTRADGTADTHVEVNPEGSYAQGDVLTNIENVMGSSQDDVLMGNAMVNELYGGAGDDELTAVANTEAGAGPDVLVGGAGDDELTGSANADVLMGGDGHDTITGGGGADRIVGGAGDDVMTGTTGNAERFVFSPADGDGDDVITNMDGDTTGTFDRIDLSAFELSPREQMMLMENISTRGDDVRIDLSDFGGGTILLQGAITLANFDADGTLTEGAIDALNTDLFVF